METSADITMFLPLCILFAATAALATEDKRLVMHSDLDLATTLGNLQQNLSDIGNKVVQQESRIAQLEAENTQYKAENMQLKSQDVQQSARIAQLESITRDIAGPGKGGSVYVRWGRNVCPGNGTDLIYKGIIGGTLYSTSKGGGSNSLCLPESPTWNKYVGGIQGAKSEIYGGEIEVDAAFSTAAFGYNYNDEDPPCATCHTQRASVMMVPGRSNCYPGWTMEYTGYLVGGHPTQASSDYICLDSRPEELPKGLDAGSNNQHILYFVEAHCGSLPCPPYQEGREVACTVCSK